VASEVRRQRELKKENLRTKRLAMDLTLDKSILQEVIKKIQKLCTRQDLTMCYGADLAQAHKKMPTQD
jgi:hypothetical protein